jgi:PAS domain S-box-containing protein
MTDSGSQAVVMADTSGHITYWSAGAEDLFGHTAAEAVGASLDLIVPSEHRERHWTGFHRAMATAECRLDRATINLPVLCRDGRELAFPARFVFLADANGFSVGAMGVFAGRQGDEQPWQSPTPLPAEGSAESTATSDGE